MSFNYTDTQALKRIRAAFGWQEAAFVEVSKNKWTVSAVVENGVRVPSHPKGIPATQLKAWVNGADCALLICDSKLKNAEKTRAETVAGLVPEGDDLIDALHRECEALSTDTTYMTQKLWSFMDASALSVDEIKSLADESGHDLTVFTEEALQEDREETIEAALEDHPLFRSAVRVAYARNEAERRDDIRELSHLLAKEFNAFNQSALI